ncbi:histidine kinase [Chryseobacterium gallinarum]|uniref:sensor histidine kinase n=1 Tax=Chryseobacterium gallinarum TaxID=1324352 RepID=UPI0020245792|nr:histidine kinase [Chryseobacterium gallinarum]MCL8538641.1 histidine kinase [Chryseobacterium gallinarum]
MAQLQWTDSGYADSLQNVLNSRTTNSVKAETNYLLCQHWSYRDTIKAKQYLQAGQKAAKGSTFLTALYYFYEGSLYHSLNPEKAAFDYLRSDSLLAKEAIPKAHYFRAKALFNYALLYEDKDNTGAAVDIVLNKVIPIAKKAGDPTLLGENYMYAGQFFQGAGQHKVAAQYYMQAIQQLQTTYKKSILFRVYVYAAQNYCQLKRMNDTQATLEKAKELLPFFTNTKMLAEYYEVEALYLWKGEKQFLRAHQSLDKGMAIAKKLDEEYIYNSLLFSKYNLYMAEGKNSQAIQVLHMLAKSALYLLKAENRKSVYNGLAQNYAAINNMTQAYRWQKKYAETSDSLAENRLTKNINELEIKYRTTENQKRIFALEAEKKQAILANKNNRLTNGLLTAGCFLLVCIAAYSIILYRKNKKISVQQLKDIRQQQEIKLSQAMLQLQEEERSRIARDLHDGVGSMLAGIKINLSGIAAKVNKPYIQCINDTMRQLDNSVTELRRIAHNLVPDILLRYGLEEALQELAETLISPKTSIDLQCLNIKTDIAIGIQLSIYRIIQELLSNAVKHADASNILVQCSQNEHIFMIAVEDDGKGLDTEDTTAHRGIGISNIKNRVAYLNGTISYSHGKNRTGTIVNIELYVTA